MQVDRGRMNQAIANARIGHKKAVAATRLDYSSELISSTLNIKWTIVDKEVRVR